MLSIVRSCLISTVVFSEKLDKIGTIQKILAWLGLHCMHNTRMVQNIVANFLINLCRFFRSLAVLNGIKSFHNTGVHSAYFKSKFSTYVTFPYILQSLASNWMLNANQSGEIIGAAYLHGYALKMAHGISWRTTLHIGKVWLP